jgi:hypothetical protein
LKERAPGATNVLAWCKLCGTLHVPGRICPTEIDATGPEKPGWRVAVETPHGVRGYGVLVAEAGTRWRSRIVTFPNVLWMVPGGGESLKFIARTEQTAVRLAIDFIRSHCVSKGYTMRDEVQFVATPERRMVAVGGTGLRAGKPAPRFERRLPVRFGRSRPTLLGHTANLSETGLFVATRTPLADGELLGLSLELEHCKVPLRGSVAWHRALLKPPLDRGMGLRLFNPPSVYVDYVRALG